MFKNKTFLILLAILALGAFLRFWNLGEPSFSADEFLDINSSYAFQKTGEWKSWDFNLGQVNTANEFSARDERAWAYKIQVAELFKFFPPTEGVARSISALWGVLTIILIYFVAEKFTNNKTIGLISAFLFAVSLDGIEFDRKLRMYAMFFPVFLTFSWTLWSAFEKEYAGKLKFAKTIWDKLSLNIFYLLPALILGALSLHLHLLTANIAFILALYFLILALVRYKKQPGLNKYNAYLGIGILGILSGLIIFGDKLKAATKELGWGINHFSYLEKVFSDYSGFLLPLGLLLLGTFYLYKKADLPKESLWLTVSFWGTLLLAIFFWDRNVGSQYIFFAQSFKIILLASGIYFVALFMKENLAKFSTRAYWASLIILLLLVPNYAFFFQKDNFYRQTSESENPNYRKIFTYVKKKRGDQDILITRNFRSFYYSGLGVKVIDFGGERTKEKITLERLETIMRENP
ncbi:MAG: hypothetical protein ACOYS2_00605, partial [Patescibacteria group bacterium]